MIPQIQEPNEILIMTSDLRNEMMSWLSDADLTFAVTGNVSLGVLCRKIGEVQQMYIDSFKTFSMDWSYHVPNPETLENSVEALMKWYADLNKQMQVALDSLTENDLNRLVNRQHFNLSIGAQIHTYREALLIFYAKATVYLNAMQKPLSDRWHGWIGT